MILHCTILSEESKTNVYFEELDGLHQTQDINAIENHWKNIPG